MNRGTTNLEGVFEIVSNMSQNNYDAHVPLDEMEFENLSTLRIDGHNFGVQKHAQRLISNRLRIPHSYLDRCPQSLQYANLNYWLEKEREQRKTFFIRFNGNQVRSILTERFKPMDNLEILYAMTKNGFRLEQEVQYCLDEAMLLVKVPEYHRTFKVRDDDRIVPGIAFSNSEIGLKCLSIETYFYRLLCSNGLVAATTAGCSRFKHISRKALDQFGDTLNEVIAESRHHNQQFLISAETPISEPLNTIETLNRQFGIGKPESDYVKQAWEAEPGHTMFAIINAFTRAGKSPDLSAESSYALESAGGRILSMVKK